MRITLRLSGLTLISCCYTGVGAIISSLLSRIVTSFLSLPEFKLLARFSAGTTSSPNSLLSRKEASVIDR